MTAPLISTMGSLGSKFETILKRRKSIEPSTSLVLELRSSEQMYTSDWYTIKSLTCKSNNLVGLYIQIRYTYHIDDKKERIEARAALHNSEKVGLSVGVLQELQSLVRDSIALVKGYRKFL